MDVVALLEGLGDDGALSKECEWKELAMLDDSSLRVVEPALCKPCAYKLTASGVGDRRLVGEVSGKDYLIKYFHGFAPRLPDPATAAWAMAAMSRVGGEAAGGLMGLSLAAVGKAGGFSLVRANSVSFKK